MRSRLHSSAYEQGLNRDAFAGPKVMSQTMHERGAGLCAGSCT